jgi:hypothetical protein
VCCRQPSDCALCQLGLPKGVNKPSNLFAVPIGAAMVNASSDSTDLYTMATAQKAFLGAYLCNHPQRAPLPSIPKNMHIHNVHLRTEHKVQQPGNSLTRGGTWAGGGGVLCESEI